MSMRQTRIPNLEIGRKGSSGQIREI